MIIHKSKNGTKILEDFYEGKVVSITYFERYNDEKPFMED
jgi:hypothetical protein